jgi:predicted permease
VDVQEAVKEGARGTPGGGTRRLNDAFVVSQFALCVVLLVGAGLLLRSFEKLLAVDPGFQPENVLVGRVALAGEHEPAKVRQFFLQLDERLGALPGVRHAGLISAAPFARGGNQQNFRVQGREPGPGEPVLVTSMREVSQGYFRAVGTPLLRGRSFADTDREGADFVAVVDESLARRFWPDGNAIGHRLRLGDDADNPWRTIVGVVASVKDQNLAQEPDRFVYLPMAQRPAWTMDMVVRTTAEPASWASAVRAELRALDRNVPLFEVHTLQGAVERSLGTRRLTNRLLLAFALAALLLSAVGIYGVMALNVSHRVNEFGIRLALGAQPRDVQALVLRRGLRLVLLATALGLIGAMATARLLASLLFQVKPVDPLTFGGVSLALAVVALAACYFPARRATATDPLEALRYE